MSTVLVLQVRRGSLIATKCPTGRIGTSIVGQVWGRSEKVAGDLPRSEYLNKLIAKYLRISRWGTRDDKKGPTPSWGGENPELASEKWYGTEIEAIAESPYLV